ncbi:hypothetical protein PPYR_10064 [Photinus pyralis]|uniref:Uncharacterized protein n=1 Tax=Photinus pyralis TaxID=7054 RepID=A0A5N4AFA1_PHOPY|nr:uncharacterized protein LOC116173123 [Photinus pyralis]KAB0796003.1 hypothetical protein PPYR_10064 [Photinus pyralis]
MMAARDEVSSDVNGNFSQQSDVGETAASEEVRKNSIGSTNATKWPEVKLREKRLPTGQEKSAAERRRHSRNRLSNRRSTGFVSAEEMAAAATLHNENTSLS